MSRVKRWQLGAAALVLLAVVATVFVVIGGGRSSHHAFAGTISVLDTDSLIASQQPGSSCTSGDYNLEGASVTITDQSGTTVGVAQLPDEGIAADGFHCLFAFVVPDLSTKASFYKITIGTHSGPSYSRAELVADHWSVALSL